MKNYSTRLAFSDIQRSEYTNNPDPAPDALLEFVDTSRHDASEPVDYDQKGERTHYARRLGYKPVPIEVIPKIPQYERGDLP